MATGLLLVRMLLLSPIFTLDVGSSQNIIPCYFNPMCSCKMVGPNFDYIQDVSCVNIPFAKIPSIPSSSISHMDIVNSHTEVLDGESFGESQIESLRLMNNKIRKIGPQTFRSMRSVIRSLDLSYNELAGIPGEAFNQLTILDWVNFHSNHIDHLDPNDWISLQECLTTIFLGENDLTSLPPGMFSRFKFLKWLNLDNNHLKTIGSDTLPLTLQTLSLVNNLLREIPIKAIRNLKSLTWLYLRGNYIEVIHDFELPTPLELDKLDLGENFIRDLPTRMFSNALRARDLHLDFNFIESLPPGAFRHIACRRLYLAMNRISEVDERAFLGLENSLALLDLEHNRLREVPKAIHHLKHLKLLYLAQNFISEMSEESFKGVGQSLEALSLSNNRLTRIPTEALRKCTKLSHMNLGHNEITGFNGSDLHPWAENLETLLLRNNKISEIPARAFHNSPRLRELSLSFNRINKIDPSAFRDLSMTLQSLEISFGLMTHVFPEKELKPLAALEWLALDNNHINKISETSLLAFGELRYLNLEGNRLQQLPYGLLHPNVHRLLGDIRLGYNSLRVIDTDTFSGLENLQTIVLSANKLVRIRSNGFRNLERLATLMMSNNKISQIEPRAFSHLPSLSRLDLQFNALKEFSANSFFNATSFHHHLALNISHNSLAFVQQSTVATNLLVKSLDLSYNLIGEIPKQFLKSVSHALKFLDLSHNKILRIDQSGFGNLENVHTIILRRNGIVITRSESFRGLPHLQILDLSHNYIDSLPAEMFMTCTRLRQLDLSYNQLQSFPRDVFTGSELEHLNLAHNRLTSMPTASLQQVAASLRYLDVSHNNIEHVDSGMFSHMPNLIGLFLAWNRLSILSDNTFTSLTQLIHLDLEGNRFRANFKELFHYSQNIHVLNLANTGLNTLQPLPLPSLIELNISSNYLKDIPDNSVSLLNKLRYLDISSNQLTVISGYIWSRMSLIKNLDVSRNDIVSLTRDSFEGLYRLEVLNIQQLNSLERFDSDTLVHLSFLDSLFIQTCPNIEKYRFRLGSTLTGLDSLKKISVEIRESVLTDQLIGALGPKLKEIVITGSTLQAISHDAFDRFLSNAELVVKISGTQITRLPDGLLASFSSVHFMTLDLSDNKLTTLSPSVLYSNKSDWEHVGTRLISGGVILTGNPWVCDCQIGWLGKWMRRWLRETIQIHTMMLERAQRIQTTARQATCKDPYTKKKRIILDLNEDELTCRSSFFGQACQTRSQLLSLFLFSMLLLVVN